MPSSRTSAPPTIADAEWLSWPGTRQVFAALSARSHEARAVGGAVRNTLLERPVNDVDFATTALPEEVMGLAEEAGLKAVPTGIDHGTVTLVAEGRGFEVTTLRQDVATDGRRASIAYTRDWAEDAARRDFTINALYADAGGALFDPLGGYGDIAARRVRFIGDAGERVREDFLRILRFFRFSAELDAGEFDPDALSACVRERAGLDLLSGERVRAELFRLLAGEGANAALHAMYDHGLLVRTLGAVPWLGRFGRLAEIEGTLGTAPDAVLRLAALAVMVAEDAERLAERLKLSGDERARLAGAAAFRRFRAGMDEQELKRALYRLGESASRDAALLAWATSGADAPGKTWRGLLKQVEDTPEPAFPVQGADVVALGVCEGPKVGAILAELERRWIEGGFSASRDDLVENARALCAEKEKK